MSSPPGKLATRDWQKIGKGGAIAAGGTILTYIVGRFFPEINANPELQSAVFVVSCVIVNGFWKLFTDTRD